MARTSTGQIPSRAVIPVALVAVLLVAVVVLLRPVAGPPVQSPTPRSIDEAAAERIATGLVLQQGPGTKVLDIAVERYEDHDTFWRLTLHVDIVPPSVDNPPQTIRIYYQVDVDKQTAAPSIFGQG